MVNKMTQNSKQKKIENKSIQVIFFFILIFFYSSLTIGTAGSSSPPDAYVIDGALMHQQINAFFCGPATLEMIFDFWGEDIDQKSIANVARTSSQGTFTWDMVRTGHFSHLSAGRGSHEAPTNGFSERKLGYASFNYSSDTFWWEDLKALIASDIPVILLMKWAPDDDTGHYRLIVGYDETKKVVYFMDSWGRNFKRKSNPDGTITWNMADFKSAWNYSEYGTPHPHWGAIMMPWPVDLEITGKTSKGSQLNITANVTYPCPRPFDCTAYPASGTNAKIIIPSGMHLKKGQPQITIGSLRAGESANVTWNVELDADGAGSWIKVEAGGLVSGEVPDIKAKGVFYPAYEYTDNIGGDAKVKI